MDSNSITVYVSALETAISNRHYSVIYGLLNYIEITETQLIELMKNSVMDGEEALLKKLIKEKNGNLHLQQEILLRMACMQGHVYIVEFLLENGADIHAADGDALSRAIFYGKYDVVQSLIKHGASPTEGNAMSYLEKYCKGEFCDEGHKKIGQYIHSWGEFYETTRKCDGYGENERKRFAVFQALDNAKTFEKIKEIISSISKVEINWLNSPCLDGIVYAMKENWTNHQVILNVLLTHDHIDACKFFLNKDLLFNISYNDAFIFCCCKFDKIEPLKLLLEKGADIHTGGGYPLEVASTYGCIQVVNFLLDYGMKSAFDRSLCVAANEGHTEIVKVLLDNGANIHVGDDNPLFRACSNGKFNTVKLLLEKGADLHAKKECCLYTACMGGHYEIAEFLLEKGAVEERERDNILVLIFSNIDGNDTDRYVDTVKLLIKHGADKNSALRWACETGDTFATKTLLTNGADIHSIQHLASGFIPDIRKILDEYSWGVYEKN